jgi:hypothetical protein
MAGSSVTITYENIHVVNAAHERKILVLSWVGDDGTGAVPNATISADTYKIKGWYLYEVKTIPGTGVPPTDNYDIVINDADGIDLADGSLADRDQTAKELVRLAGHMVIDNLVVAISNQSVNSATGTIKIIFTAD